MPEGSDETVVVADTHEPDKIKNLTLGHPDTDQWKEITLDAADIVVNGVGIERKRPDDFASSMLEDRLDEQVEKLKDAYDDAAILIEGGFDDFSSLSHTSLNPQSARGKAASIHMRHGISVVPTGGTPDTETAKRLLVDYAIRLGRKATEEPSSGYLQSSAVGSDEPLGKRLWGCFDDVGPVRAGLLFEEIGSPLDLAQSLAVLGGQKTQASQMIDEVQTVEGFGESTAERLADQFGLPKAPYPSDREKSASEAAQHAQNESEG